MTAGDIEWTPEMSESDLQRLRCAISLHNAAKSIQDFQFSDEKIGRIELALLEDHVMKVLNVEDIDLPEDAIQSLESLQCFTKKDVLPRIQSTMLAWVVCFESSLHPNLMRKVKEGNQKAFDQSMQPRESMQAFSGNDPVKAATRCYLKDDPPVLIDRCSSTFSPIETLFGAPWACCLCKRYFLIAPQHLEYNGLSSTPKCLFCGRPLSR